MRLMIQYGNDGLSFNHPVEILTARTADEIFQCLEKIDTSELWAAGFVAYEAASALDDALKTQDAGKLPLFCFGLFNPPECLEQRFDSAPIRRSESPGPYHLSEWMPSVTRDEYYEAIALIKEHIAAGDTYQLNYTFRLHADFFGDPGSFFWDLVTAQRGHYAAFIETDDFSICSASPELFFELKDGTIISRPMKGTFPRGQTEEADCAALEALKSSEKDRAENIMIVDMIRNDLGRIAEVGSVETLRRFDIEKYPTVWQMTSTVQGKMSKQDRENPTHASGIRQGERGLTDLLKNLFPCASVTGAPKAKTMELIRKLEKGPRGMYTGAIGFMAPNGHAQFNVAIRTAVIDKIEGRAEYGIGGGIVWDSNAEAEYEEALSKALILPQHPPVADGSKVSIRPIQSAEKDSGTFQCLETMLYESKAGVFLLDRHLKRLADSAAVFHFKMEGEEIRDQLCRRFVLSGDQEPLETPILIRLLLSKEGALDIQASEIERQSRIPTLVIAKNPVNSRDLFLYHKTTNRARYERAKADFPEVDDVLLFNERGEITESCIANVVVELEGRKVTPPVSCGLLAGTLREELLESGEIEERVILIDDLKRTSAIWLINSVRKWRKANLSWNS